MLKLAHHKVDSRFLLRKQHNLREFTCVEKLPVYGHTSAAYGRLYGGWSINHQYVLSSWNTVS